MRTQTRLFTSFLAVLLILLCSGMIANADDHDLVKNVEIPPMEDVYGNDAKPMYLNPTKELTNKMIQWANTCTGHAINLRDSGEILIHKREAARIAAYGTDGQWKGNLINYVANVATRNVIDPLKELAKTLLGMSDKLAREQAYADACKAVNEHYYPTTHDAKVMMEGMYAVAVAVINNYKQYHSGSDLNGLTPLPIPPISIPAKETPRWRCYGNGIGTGLSESLLTCKETYYTPTEAFEDHRVSCKDYKTSSYTSYCGEFPWYSCDANHDMKSDKHKVRTCTKTYTAANGDTSPCGWEYKKCRFDLRDHNKSDWYGGKTMHSDVANPIASNDDDDDDTASNPPSTPTTPSTPDPTPDPPSPTYHACGIHETTVSGDHSIQASCSLHSKNGQSCTVSNFYACQTHTPEYPPPPSVSCTNGHTYDPSKRWQVNKHKTRTCRFCSQQWETCGSGRPSACNDSKRRKNNKGCWAKDD